MIGGWLTTDDRRSMGVYRMTEGTPQLQAIALLKSRSTSTTPFQQVSGWCEVIFWVNQMGIHAILPK
jgi:hypothetical protein